MPALRRREFSGLKDHRVVEKVNRSLKKGSLFRFFRVVWPDGTPDQSARHLDTSRNLFTADGKRKYLTGEERSRFLEAAQEHSRGEVRSFCEVLCLYRVPDHQGPGPHASEHRFLDARDHFPHTQDALRYRTVPMPESLIDTLDLVHGIRKARRRKGRAQDTALWPWSRTQGWKHVAAVMAQASIEGPHASPKGLRHCFGVIAATQTRNPRLVQNGSATAI